MAPVTELVRLGMEIPAAMASETHALRKLWLQSQEVCEVAEAGYAPELVDCGLILRLGGEQVAEVD